MIEEGAFYGSSPKASNDGGRVSRCVCPRLFLRYLRIASEAKLSCTAYFKCENFAPQSLFQHLSFLDSCITAEQVQLTTQNGIAAWAFFPFL